MHWEQLTDVSQLEKIKKDSASLPALIFKHSTRCSISATALSRLERNWEKLNPEGIRPYFLELLNFRPLSNKIQEDFLIKHESPQALLIKNGQCVYDASHLAISMEEIVRHAKA
jgi:bacillithiol system protein YtxJ